MSPARGKLASLEDFISMQNEELAAQRQEIESADRNGRQGRTVGIDSECLRSQEL